MLFCRFRRNYRYYRTRVLVLRTHNFDTRNFDTHSGCSPVVRNFGTRKLRVIKSCTEFMVCQCFFIFSWCLHGVFKELDFKELEIHWYSLMDIHQWIHWWKSINEFINGHPSMNSLMDHQWIWSLLLGPFLCPHGPPLGPMGAKRRHRLSRPCLHRDKKSLTWSVEQLPIEWL